MDDEQQASDDEPDEETGATSDAYDLERPGLTIEELVAVLI